MAQVNQSPFISEKAERLLQTMPRVYLTAVKNRKLAIAGAQLATLGMLREGLSLREVRAAVGKLSARNTLLFLAARQLNHWEGDPVAAALRRAVGLINGFRGEVAMHYLIELLAEEASRDLWTAQTLDDPRRAQVLLTPPAELLGHFLSLFLLRRGFSTEPLAAALGAQVLAICEQVRSRESMDSVELVALRPFFTQLEFVGSRIAAVWEDASLELVYGMLRPAAASHRVTLKSGSVPFGPGAEELLDANRVAHTAYRQELRRRNELRVRALRPAFRAATSEMCRLVLSFL